MATSHDRSSSMDSPPQLYHPGLAFGRGPHPPPPSAAPPPMFGGLYDSTVLTTTSNSSTSCSGGAIQPGIEGRVVKPARRRSRASRRAPTTLLNTDTTNFRAMVQQFTGIPSGPYSASYPAGAAGIGDAPIASYGLHFGDSQAHNPNPMLMPFGQALQQHPFGQELQYRVPQPQFQTAADSNSRDKIIITTTATATATMTTRGNDDGNFVLGFNNSGADCFYFDGTQ